MTSKGLGMSCATVHAPAENRGLDATDGGRGSPSAARAGAAAVSPATNVRRAMPRDIRSGSHRGVLCMSRCYTCRRPIAPAPWFEELGHADPQGLALATCLLGSSAGFAYVMPKGPMPATSTMV